MPLISAAMFCTRFFSSSTPSLSVLAKSVRVQSARTAADQVEDRINKKIKDSIQYFRKPENKGLDRSVWMCKVVFGMYTRCK